MLRMVFCHTLGTIIAVLSCVRHKLITPSHGRVLNAQYLLLQPTCLLKYYLNRCGTCS